MRYLILSDLHANLEALEAVAADARGRYDEVLCLGDVVGYGADPNAVTEWTRANARVTVRGNHDRACTGQVDLSWFNPMAQAAVVWTDRMLTPENHVWLKELPQGPLEVAGFQLVHGAPADEDQYVLNNEDAWLASKCCTTKVTFFGHTHVQGGFEFRGRRVIKIEKPSRQDPERVLEFGQADRYLVNAGSVGQPRDRDPRAAYALYDPDEPRIVFRRVEYDLAKAQRKIRDASLPGVLADRLADGR